jgi:hypothetical protein
MNRAKIRQQVFDILGDGLWHTTLPNRFDNILQDGAILPEPTLPENERWGTKEGPDGHPYVRSLGGVSLFDFHGFDEDEYYEMHPQNSLAYFIPCIEKYGAATWIEIDRISIDASFISGADLLCRWKEENSTRRIMAQVEAAYIGPLSKKNFVRAMQVSKGSVEVHEFI